MPEPKELARAQLLLGGGGGLRSEVTLSQGVDRRVLLMLAHDLLVALEQGGFLTSAVAQARPLIKDQLAAWGLAHGPYLPATPADGGDGKFNIAV